MYMCVYLCVTTIMTHYIFRKYLHVDRNTSNVNMFIQHLRLGMEHERSTNKIGDGLTRNNLWILPLWRKQILPWEKWAVEKSAVRSVRFSYSSFAEIIAFCSMTESCIQHPNEKTQWAMEFATDSQAYWNPLHVSTHFQFEGDTGIHKLSTTSYHI